MKITDIIKNKITFLDEVEKLLQIKKRGMYYWSVCPFHKEKTPSLCINERKEIFHCFGCGEHGDIFSLIMKCNNKTFTQVIHDFCKELSIKQHNVKEIDHEYNAYINIMEKAKNIYVSQLKNNNEAMNYLLSRGITHESIDKFQLGYCNNNKAVETLLQDGHHINHLEILGICNKTIGKDRMRNRIVFPIFSKKQQVIGFSARTLTDQQPKYINSPDSKIFSKSLNLYNQHNMNYQQIFLVEGYTDVIALSQMGYVSVAAMSTHFSSEHFLQIIKHCEKVYFMLDGDSAGQQSIIKNIKTLLPVLNIHNQVFICTLPRDQDPMNLYNLNNLQKYINNACDLHKWLEDYFNRKLCDTPHQLAKIYKEKEEICNLIEDKHLKLAYKKFLFFFNKNKTNQSFLHTDVIKKEMQLICTLMNFPDLIINFLQQLAEIKFKDQKIQKTVNFILEQTSKANHNLDHIVKEIQMSNKEITENLKFFNISSIIIDRSFILRHLENIINSLYSLDDKNVVDAARRILYEFRKQQTKNK